MKVSLFMTNYNREVRIEVDIKKNEKMEKVMEFAEKIKKIQEEAEVALKKHRKK